MATPIIKRRPWPEFSEWLKECKLEKPLLDLCGKRYVSLKDVYEPSQLQSLVEARGEIWTWLHDVIGRSFNEIAKTWARDPNTIRTGIARHRLMKAENKPADHARSGRRTGRPALAKAKPRP